jgi:hypothetical protein
VRRRRKNEELHGGGCRAREWWQEDKESQLYFDSSVYLVFSAAMGRLHYMK